MKDIFCYCLLITTSWVIGQTEINKAWPSFQKTEAVKVSSGSVFRVEDFGAEQLKPRTVDVWLPETYTEAQKYKVLYMHDGQMLFDKTTTWNQQEWMVDEVLSRLLKQDSIANVIVVAIHNRSEVRWQDYFPKKAIEYMPEATRQQVFKEARENNFDAQLNADAYLKFIVEAVKPLVDRTFSTLPDKQNTFIAGSSMGGLISMYAVSEYPEVFGGAACISTHWVGVMPREGNPFPDAIFAYMKENLPNAGSHQLYFDYGTKTLDQHYPVFAERVDAILKDKGYTAETSKNLKFDGADHSETSWQQRLHIPMQFLIKKD